MHDIHKEHTNIRWRNPGIFFCYQEILAYQQAPKNYEIHMFTIWRLVSGMFFEWVLEL